MLDADGELLDLGRGTRDCPRHLKEAMLAAGRDRCAEPGCDAPPTWLEADHIVPWSRTGRTATHNGQMLCSPANRNKGDRPGTPPTSPPQREGHPLRPNPRGAEPIGGVVALRL